MAARPPRALIPLSDGVGEVVEVGAGVTQVKPGDRVARHLHAGLHRRRHYGWTRCATAFGGAIDGMLAEYVVLSEHGVVLGSRASHR